jgi:hypothetical protein
LADAPYASFEVASGAEENLLGSFLSVFANGEGGLMGLAVPPDFPRSPYVYAMETYKGAEGVKNRIIRLRDEGDHGRFDRVIFDGLPGFTFHNGGRIGFRSRRHALGRDGRDLRSRAGPGSLVPGREDPQADAGGRRAGRQSLS